MNFAERLKWLQQNEKDWLVRSSGEYNHSADPEYDYTHFESVFCSDEIQKHPGDTILDIGSYLHFTLGLGCRFKNVTSIDCRPYKGPIAQNATFLVCDAREIPLPDKSFPLIVSQCTLEHIGLGCYGDPLDFAGDRRMVSEMRRILQPGGFLIITTTVANTKRPVVMYNVHRIYNFATLNKYFGGMRLCSVKFYNVEHKELITKDQVTTAEGGFDVCGSCWQKV